MSTLFVMLCFRVTTIHLNVNQASVEIKARGVPPNQSLRGRRSEEMTQSNNSSLRGSEVPLESERR